MEPVDPSAMRRLNTSTTLRALHRAGTLTMAGLHEASGLSRRALELILEPLLREGWVVGSLPEGGGARPVGRPARSFSFNYRAGYLVGIQVGIDVVAVVVADLSGAVLGRVQHSVSDRWSMPRVERLAHIRECVSEALDIVGVPLSAVLAATVSTPGIVHTDGTVDLPLSIREWSGFSLPAELERYFPCPVTVENDAKLAAIGEKWAGTGDAVDDFVWMLVEGDRFGLGIVIRGELYRGNDGAAGEIVWADSLGFSALTHHVLSALSDEEHPRHAEALDTVVRARRGDPDALASVRELAVHMAAGLTTIAWVLAPEEIIIGGTIGTITDILIPAIEEELAGNRHTSETRIIGSELGREAILAGTLKNCLDRVGDLLFTGAELPPVPARAARRAGS